jgi:hypothetical protein
MSLNVLKQKTNALYLKNKSKSSKQSKFIKPQFMNCCNIYKNYILSNNGFYVNGGLRSNTYIGKQYLTSSPNMRYTSNSQFVKPSVVNHSTHIKRKLAHIKVVVKPIDSGTIVNHSQGTYIERIKSCNSDVFDVNQDHKYENMKKNCKKCNPQDVIYTKNTKQPLSMEEYINYKKKPCLKDIPKTKGIGKTCCVILD